MTTMLAALALPVERASSSNRIPKLLPSGSRVELF